MPHCPNCGAEVDQSTAFCPSCGESLQGGQGQPQQGQGQSQQPPQGQGQPPQGQGQPQQPPQDQGQPQQPPQGQGQPQQPPQGRSQGQGRPPRGGAGAAEGEGMSRRALLAGAGGGVVVLAGGGYLAYTQFMGGGAGPDGTVEQFVQALNDGDAQQANELIHPNSPLGQVTSSQLQQLQSVGLSVESTSVVSQSGDRATVQASLTLGSQTQTTTFQLRRSQGEWLLYSSDSSFGGDISYGATVQGEITSGGQRDPIYQKLASTYDFLGSAGDRVQIEMRSDSIDPYLILTDGNGNMVAENDDITYGVNLNSRIRTSLPTTGRYTVWCASYSGSATGPFTLSLSQA
ncbi:MAG: zinc-ribbon domain-containing protein [Haloarculaceae archaeon]